MSTHFISDLHLDPSQPETTARLLDYLVSDFDRDDEIGTFYQGVERLPAGHAMEITPRGPRTWR